MTRLLLVRHGPTAATERGAFGADEPLTEGAREAASALAAQLPGAEVVLSSPALRCRQTADALCVTPSIDPELAECRFGDWEGSTFTEIAERAPDLVDGWLREPGAAPHGGESLTGFAGRVDGWLERLASRAGAKDVLAVTHAGVIRVAVVAALGAPIASFWRLAVAPLSVTELCLDDSGDWTLVRLNWTPGP